MTDRVSLKGSLRCAGVILAKWWSGQLQVPAHPWENESMWKLSEQLRSNTGK